MKKLVAIALLLATPAQADLLQVDFTGTAFYLRATVAPGDTTPGTVQVDCNYCTVQLHLPFTATFLFNTDLGTLSTPGPGMHRLDGPALVSASLTIVDPTFGGTWAIPYVHFFDSTYLTWGDDPQAPIAANSGPPDYYHLSAATSATAGIHGQYQFGICPSSYTPCGVIEQNTAVITNLSNPAPVPGPVAGSLGGAIRVLLRLGHPNRTT
jgi:hypothetical protein